MQPGDLKIHKLNNAQNKNRKKADEVSFHFKRFTKKIQTTSYYPINPTNPKNPSSDNHHRPSLNPRFSESPEFKNEGQCGVDH
jgi:hypothetical protein